MGTDVTTLSVIWLILYFRTDWLRNSRSGVVNASKVGSFSRFFYMTLLIVISALSVTCAIFRLRRCAACGRMILPWQSRVHEGMRGCFHSVCYGEESI